MEIRGRTLLAAIAACSFILLFTADSLPSPPSDAGHAYSVARQRYADLKKSPKKKKYRSYWIDCIRTFESIEQKYPSTPQAADSCFDRSGVYLDLYNFNRFTKDASRKRSLAGYFEVDKDNIKNIKRMIPYGLE